MTAECERIAAAIRDGATIDEAARHADRNVHSVRRMLTEGRKRPDGKHGGFAAAVDKARGERKQAERALDGPVTLAEAEAVLAKALRKGSIGALKVWFDRHDRQQQPAEDELTWMES